MKEEFKIILLIGPPGAGKGTAGSRLALEYGLYHLSAGDYLRNILLQDEMPVDIGDLDLKEYIHKRWLLPADIMVKVLAHKLDQIREEGYQVVFVDGFPREEASAIAFDEVIGKPSAVVHFICPTELAKTRFLSRGRGDDDAEIFDWRHACHVRDNGIIMQRYEDVIHEVNSSGTAQSVYERLVETVRACGLVP